MKTKIKKEWKYWSTPQRLTDPNDIAAMACHLQETALEWSMVHTAFAYESIQALERYFQNGEKVRGLSKRDKAFLICDAGDFARIKLAMPENITTAEWVSYAVKTLGYEVRSWEN
jgi:hypothetical protein